jgi:DNA-binding NarL/FixJ family response regulator
MRASGGDARLRDDPATGDRGRPIRVVLADDHVLMRRGIRALLEARSDIVVVGEAADGAAAVAAAAALRPEVVVMDITMPGLDGIEATRRIRAGVPGVKVLALTMRSEKGFIVGILQAGASAYLPKGCSFEDLVAAIHAVAAGRPHLSEAIRGTAAEDYVRAASAPAAAVGRPLTTRQREVLRLLAEGKSNKQVAQLLDLSVKTVEAHRARLTARLGMSGIAELTRYALREGLTALE